MAGLNVYAELIRAQLENLGADPSAGLIARVYFNTASNKVQLDNGSNIRAFLVNDAYLVVGNNGTANNNVRINRSANTTLQFLKGGDSTAEGSAAAATQFATINANFTGSLFSTVNPQTTTYQALVSDDLILASGSAFTITLPAATVGKKTLTIKKTDATLANIITIARAGADTITDTAASLTSTTLNTVGECVTLVSDGVSVWYVAKRTIPSVWTSYTPTSSFVTNCTTTGFWRRLGDSIQIQIKTAVAGAIGTPGTYTATIPTGLTLDTSKLVQADNTVSAGTGSVWDNSATTYYPGYPCYNSTTTLAINVTDDAAAGVFATVLTHGSTITFAASDFITFITIPLPVSGWNA